MTTATEIMERIPWIARTEPTHICQGHVGRKRTPCTNKARWSYTLIDNIIEYYCHHHCLSRAWGQNSTEDERHRIHNFLDNQE